MNENEIKMYSDLMQALKKENEEYISLQESKAYRYGRYVKRIRENFCHPGILAKKIRATKAANRIKKEYPHVESNQTVFREPDYISDNRIAIYTSIFGKYDAVLEPAWIPNNCDFFIVTDQEVPATSAWKTIDVDWNKIGIAGNVMKNRFCKMFPYKLPELQNYKYSVYIDGNIKPISDFTEFVNRIGESGIAFHFHSSRDCVYVEAGVCVYSGKETKENIASHMDFLRTEGFPEHYGMLECNLIARDHNSDLMKRVMEMWWTEFCQRSKRDQLSLPYVLYKNNVTVSSVATLGNNIYRNYAVRVVKHE